LYEPPLDRGDAEWSRAFARDVHAGPDGLTRSPSSAIAEAEKEGSSMSFRRVALIAVLALSLGSSSTLLAQKASHKGRLSFDRPIAVAGQTLKAGQYQVRWEDDGTTAQVKVVKDAKVLVTTTAKVVALEKKPIGDRTDTVRDANGQESIARIQFAGQMQELQFGDQAAAK
jgi:hypothetical protein